MPSSASLAVVSAWIDAHPYLWALILIWSLIWKGFALWKSAERGQKYWFMAILIINTLGLLDIFYIFVIAKQYKVEVVNQ
jgi:hypothetical protein